MGIHSHIKYLVEISKYKVLEPERFIDNTHADKTRENAFQQIPLRFFYQNEKVMQI